jgi:hypothetical protein
LGVEFSSQNPCVPAEMLFSAWNISGSWIGGGSSFSAYTWRFQIGLNNHRRYAYETIAKRQQNIPSSWLSLAATGYDLLKCGSVSSSDVLFLWLIYCRFFLLVAVKHSFDLLAHSFRGFAVSHAFGVLICWLRSLISLRMRKYATTSNRGESNLLIIIVIGPAYFWNIPREEDTEMAKYNRRSMRYHKLFQTHFRMCRQRAIIGLANLYSFRRSCLWLHILKKCVNFSNNFSFFYTPHHHCISFSSWQ